MARAGYQVLVLAYFPAENGPEYCIFHRSDMDAWQFIAGGGEAEDADSLAAARREAWEEAGIAPDSPFFSLAARGRIPARFFTAGGQARETGRGNGCPTVPEYAFAVAVRDKGIRLSPEHTEYAWVSCETALKRLKFESNKAALRELDGKIKEGLLF